MKTTIINILFFLLLMGGWVVVHETTHKVVFEMFGCENVHFVVGMRGFETIASCPDNRSDTAQAMVEAVGYQNGFLLLIIIIIMFMKDDTQYVVIEK